MFPIKDDIPTRRFPVLTVAIIAICCAVYFLFEHGLWELGATGNERVLEYGAIPYELTHPGKECAEAAGQLVCEGQPGVSGTAPDQAPWWLTIFTAMFMHGSLLHLARQHAVPLDLREQHRGLDGRVPLRRPSTCSAGLVALAAQVLVDPNAAVPTVGASGAIAAVLGRLRAALSTRACDHGRLHHHLLHDHRAARAARARLLDPHPALLGASDLGSQAAGGGGGVAYFAHIGGFVFGLIAIRLFADRVQEDYEQAHRLPVY